MQNGGYINLIEKELRDGYFRANPGGAAEARARLSGELSFVIARQTEIEIERSKNWLNIRQDHKSDTAATRAWEKTPEGIDWLNYESLVKRLKVLLSGLQTIIKLAEAEQMNLQ